MNQFTLDELDFIFKYMMQCGSRGNLSQYNDALIKVKSMIDNYCEHQNDPRINAMPCAGAPKLCTKCNEFYL